MHKILKEKFDKQTEEEKVSNNVLIALNPYNIKYKVLVYTNTDEIIETATKIVEEEGKFQIHGFIACVNPCLIVGGAIVGFDDFIIHIADFSHHVPMEKSDTLVIKWKIGEFK